MTFIVLDTRRCPPNATLCMPGCPPRHVCVAERRSLLTYLLTVQNGTASPGRGGGPGHTGRDRTDHTAQTTSEPKSEPLVHYDATLPVHKMVNSSSVHHEVENCQSGV